jgi:hypothetical protein
MFILGPACEAYCLALDIDYKALQERAAVLYREAHGKNGGVGGTVRGREAGKMA